MAGIVNSASDCTIIIAQSGHYHVNRQHRPWLTWYTFQIILYNMMLACDGSSKQDRTIWPWAGGGGRLYLFDPQAIYNVD